MWIQLLIHTLITLLVQLISFSKSCTWTIIESCWITYFNEGRSQPFNITGDERVFESKWHNCDFVSFIDNSNQSQNKMILLISLQISSCHFGFQFDNTAYSTKLSLNNLIDGKMMVMFLLFWNLAGEYKQIYTSDIFKSWKGAMPLTSEYLRI